MRYGKLMMIRSTDKDRFKSFADLDEAGTRIAYNKGGLNESFAKTMFKQAMPAVFDSNALATADLLAGKVDAQVADSTAAIYMARQDGRIAAMDPGNVFNPVYVAILISGSIRSSSTARSPKSGPSGSVTSNNQGEKQWHVFRLSTART